MKIIFIRHAEPDYTKDSLTEKGKEEARLLAERTKNWKVTHFYASPLGRAQETAAPTLSHFGIPLTCTFPDFPEDKIVTPDPKKCIVYPWLREVNALICEEKRQLGSVVSWDFLTDRLTENKVLYDVDHWREAPILSPEYSDFVNQVDWVYKGLDGLLAQHGYIRDGLFYKTKGDKLSSDHYMKYDGNTKEHMKQAGPEGDVIVIFCHLGVMMTMLSHLINVPPHALLQGCFVPTSSVTVVSAEEREAGKVIFRMQTLGDANHLTKMGEPISYYGGFAQPFQG